MASERPLVCSCKAWTIDTDGSCQLASSAGTAYPKQGAYSGYPLKSDPAGYCQVRKEG